MDFNMPRTRINGSMLPSHRGKAVCLLGMAHSEHKSIEFELEEEGEGTGLLGATPDSMETESDITASSSEQLPATRELELPTDTDDSELNKDSKFLNELGKLIHRHRSTTSIQMMPHLVQMHSIYMKARRSIKRRLESSGPLRQHLVSSLGISKCSVSPTSDPDDIHAVDSSPTDDQILKAAMTINVGSYVLVNSGRHYLPACIVRDEREGLAVRYYDQSGDLFSPQDATYDILREDIVQTLDEPSVIPRGSRIFYKFRQ